MHPTHSEEDRLILRKRALGMAGYTSEDTDRANAMTDEQLAAYRKARRENEVA